MTMSEFYQAMQETGDEEEEIYDKSVIKQTLVVARTNDGGDDDDNDDGNYGSRQRGHLPDRNQTLL